MSAYLWQGLRLQALLLNSSPQCRAGYKKKSNARSPVTSYFTMISSLFTLTLRNIFIPTLWTRRQLLGIKVSCPEFLGKYERVWLQLGQLQSPCKPCPKPSKTGPEIWNETGQQSSQHFSRIGSAAPGRGGAAGRCLPRVARANVSKATGKISRKPRARWAARWADFKVLVYSLCVKKCWGWIVGRRSGRARTSPLPSHPYAFWVGLGRRLYPLGTRAREAKYEDACGWLRTGLLSFRATAWPRSWISGVWRDGVVQKLNLTRVLSPHPALDPLLLISNGNKPALSC